MKLTLKLQRLIFFFNAAPNLKRKNSFKLKSRAKEILQQKTITFIRISPYAQSLTTLTWLAEILEVKRGLIILVTNNDEIRKYFFFQHNKNIL